MIQLGDTVFTPNDRTCEWEANMVIGVKDDYLVIKSLETEDLKIRTIHRDHGLSKDMDDNWTYYPRNDGKEW